ncbi:MAG: DUF5060 domain-containing protein [Chthoniobacterales bacterium]
MAGRSGKRHKVEGFCDHPDGSIFRIRFMPFKLGDYAYSVTYRHGNFERVHSGAFKAIEGRCSGILRVDPGYSWHFIWEGSGKHFFSERNHSISIDGLG